MEFDDSALQLAESTIGPVHMGCAGDLLFSFISIFIFFGFFFIVIG